MSSKTSKPLSHPKKLSDKNLSVEEITSSYIEAIKAINPDGRPGIVY